VPRANEPIVGTRNARIVRVPFRTESGEIVPDWISRFQSGPTWSDSRPRRLARSPPNAKAPDFIIGNYSDGNIVASMLAHALGVTQCNIAHALEKTKYLYSDLYWKEHEAEHHFACQYTADLISMNTADFIITSTLSGDRRNQGIDRPVRELPGIHPAGAVPRQLWHRRLRSEVQYRLAGRRSARVLPLHATGTPPGGIAQRRVRDDLRRTGPAARGCLQERGKPLLMAMSRLDRIKNSAGLLAWYAGSPPLRAEANLLIIGGHLNPDASGDPEEAEQIRHLHALMDEHQLDGQVRWIGMQTDKHLVRRTVSPSGRYARRVRPARCSRLSA
jgi:sucrose synthase